MDYFRRCAEIVEKSKNDNEFNALEVDNGTTYGKTRLQIVEINFD